MLRHTGKFFWKGKVGGFPSLFFTSKMQDVGIFFKSVNEFSDKQDLQFSNAADTSNKNNLKTVFKNKCLKENDSRVRPTAGGDRSPISGGAWEDIFGNLTTSDGETVKPAFQTPNQDKDLLEDESNDGCEEDYRPLRVIYHKLSPEWYNKQMKKYAKEGKIERAIDVLEVIMLKNDRVRPLPSHFYTLICLLSKTGDTKKAFHFFSKMRDFGYKPIPQVFTALFDACSKSIYGKEDGFERATKLIHTMKENNITPNQTTFNAMIKTFGMLGKSEIALYLADQNLSLYRPDDKTIANILIAAAGDQVNGMALAIGIWRVASLRKIKPTVFHYMLLLRAIRCCGIGDEDKFYQMLIQTSPYEMQEKLQLSLAEFQKRMKEGNLTSEDYLPCLNCPPEGALDSVATSDVQLTLSDMTQTDCNVMGTHSCDSTMTASPLDIVVTNTQPQALSVSTKSVDFIETDSGNFQDILKPGEISILNMYKIRNKYERLELLGGVSGFLARMKRDRIKPNVAVFGQLFHIVETLEEEEFLFSAMEKLLVSPDIDIISHAMLKRLRRFEKEEAKRLLELMQQKGLMPNIFVWKYLAFIECRNGEALRQFLDELQHNDIALTVHLMDGLMRSSDYTFGDKKYLLQLMDKLDIYPTQYFVDRVHGIIKHTQERLRRMALQKKDYSEEQREFMDFQHYFHQWLKTVPMQKS